MKKAKMMLVAVAAFAVVGGALAFKANKFSKVLYIGSTIGVLPSTTLTYNTTLIGDGTKVFTAPASNVDITSFTYVVSPE